MTSSTARSLTLLFPMLVAGCAAPTGANRASTDPTTPPPGREDEEVPAST
jgi:hypothetical protein